MIFRLHASSHDILYVGWMWLRAASCDKCGRALTTPAPRRQGLGIGILESSPSEQSCSVGIRHLACPPRGRRRRRAMTITNSSDIIGTGRGERELTGAGDLAESGTESISDRGGSRSPLGEVDSGEHSPGVGNCCLLITTSGCRAI